MSPAAGRCVACCAGARPTGSSPHRSPGLLPPTPVSWVALTLSFLCLAPPRGAPGASQPRSLPARSLPCGSGSWRCCPGSYRTRAPETLLAPGAREAWVPSHVASGWQEEASGRAQGLPSCGSGGLCGVCSFRGAAARSGAPLRGGGMCPSCLGRTRVQCPWPLPGDRGAVSGAGHATCFQRGQEHPVLTVLSPRSAPLRGPGDGGGGEVAQGSARPR